MKDGTEGSPGPLAPSESKALVQRTTALVRRGLRSLIAPPKRILDFPDKRSIGTLFFQYDREDWFWQRKSCEARGLIRVPANEPIRLEFRHDAAEYLSILDKFGPNDLQRLSLAGLEIDDSDLRYVSHLTGLLGINLGRTPVSGAGLIHLRELSALDEICLSGTKMEDQALRALPNHPQLLALALSDTAVGDAGMTFLPAVQRLQELDLSGTQISDVGVRPLANLTTLKELDLSRTRIGDLGVKELRNATWLEWIDLTATRVTDDGLDHVANLAGLHHLQLAETAITDRGLAKLRRLPNLASLDLGSTRVTARGLLTLRDLPELWDLTLTDTGTTEADIEALRESMPHLSNVVGGETGARCSHCGSPNYRGGRSTGDLLTCRRCKAQFRLGDRFHAPSRDSLIRRMRNMIENAVPIDRPPKDS